MTGQILCNSLSSKYNTYKGFMQNVEILSSFFNWVETLNHNMGSALFVFH